MSSTPKYSSSAFFCRALYLQPSNQKLGLTLIELKTEKDGALRASFHLSLLFDEHIARSPAVRVDAIDAGNF